MNKKLVSIVLVLLMSFSVALAKAPESGFQQSVGDWEYNLVARIVHIPNYDNESVTLKWSKNVEYNPELNPNSFAAYSWGNSGYLLVNCESQPSDTSKYIRTLKWQLTSSNIYTIIQHIGIMYELIDGVYVEIYKENLYFGTEKPYGLGLLK